VEVEKEGLRRGVWVGGELAGVPVGPRMGKSLEGCPDTDLNRPARKRSRRRKKR